MFDRRALAGYAVILCLGALLAASVHFKAREDYAAALSGYRLAQQDKANDAARGVEASLEQIYDNLRTISFLPSVRRLDRHGTNLGDDALKSIQQIYNNLRSAVAVSEVYIVPESLDPDRIDPVTGEPEVPILMFDELIVDAGTHKDEQDPWTTEQSKAETDESEPADLPEEVEIFEYRLLREQMAWLREHYPDSGTIDGMKLPFISGREVITCDNTIFIHTRADADRSGIILSVPFFGPDGKFKGTISAITLTRNIQAMLPPDDYALLNPSYGYGALSVQGGQATQSAAWVQAVKADPALPFSAVVPLDLHDPRGSWVLWAGHPASEFFTSSSVRAVENFRLLGYVFTIFLTVLCLVLWTMQRRNFRTIERHNAALEAGIDERTRALSDTNTRLRTEIDDHRRTGEALRRAFAAAEAASKAKSAFLANVSHELRTPLNAIIGFSEIMRDELAGPIGAEYHEYATHILDGGKRLLGVVDGVLTLTRQEARDDAGPTAAFDVAALVERQVRRALETAKAAGVGLACTLRFRPQLVVGDEAGLGHALDALISNAIKFNRTGGRVEVSLQHSAEGALRIVVEDTGIGIAAGNIADMLSPLTQLDPSLSRSHDGLGLGLPVAKLVAEAHGGRLEIDSTPGEGTRVAIVLPAERTRLPDASEPVAPELALSA